MNLLAEQTGSKIFMELGLQLPDQLSFFLSGCLLYYYFEVFKNKYKYFLIPSTALLLVNESTQSQFLMIKFFVPISLAIVVVSIAFFTPPLKIFSSHGDFSYGIYIYHYPIIQFFISLGLFQFNNYLALLATTLVLISTAYGSWNLVEKPFLKDRSGKKTV